MSEGGCAVSLPPWLLGRACVCSVDTGHGKEAIACGIAHCRLRNGLGILFLAAVTVAAVEFLKAGELLDAERSRW